MDTDQQTQVRRLPLWKAFLDENEIDYGFTVQADELSRFLDLKPDTVEFAFAVQNIRKELRKRGMVFTSRGENGERYVVAPPAKNQGEMARMQRTAINAMKQGVILGTSTPVEMLTADERRRHEALTERMATRLALVSRKTIKAEPTPKAITTAQ